MVVKGSHYLKPSMTQDFNLHETFQLKIFQ